MRLFVPPQLFVLLIFLVHNLLFGAPANAATISMLDNVGRFVSIDTDTGRAETLNGGLSGFSNLAYDSNLALHWTTDSQNNLYHLSSQGAIGSRCGVIPHVKGLAVAPNGDLYGYDFDNDALIKIHDPDTGDYTTIGTGTGFTLSGPGNQLWFDGNDLLVLMNNQGEGVYGKIDTQTGIGTTLFTDPSYLGMQILGTPIGGSTVYLSDTVSLYTLNTTSGQVTFDKLIEYTPCECVPEPTSMLSLGGLTLPLLFRKWRRRTGASKKACKDTTSSDDACCGGSCSTQARSPTPNRLAWAPGSRKTRRKLVRRVLFEPLEQRLAMTANAFICGDVEQCPCSCEGSTSTSPATGFGTTYGQSMGNFSEAPSGAQQANYSANNVVASNGIYGNNRLSSSTPTLVFLGKSATGIESLQLPWSGTNIKNFRQSSPGSTIYNSDSGNTDWIQKVGSEFTYNSLDGESIRFRDFSSTNTLLRGQFISRSDTQGNRLVVTANFSSGAIASLASYNGTNPNPVELWQYRYIPNAQQNAGKLQSVEVRRNDNTLLRSTAYSYYNKSDASGSLGDLKSMTVRDGAGATIDAQYFRYYKSGQADFGRGFNSALKYSFDFDSYQRLKANITNIDAATDTQIAPYAREYFQYDSSRRITRMDVQAAGCTTCTGGIATSTFVYETRPFVTGSFNSWAFKVTETRPDGNQKITYENYRRQKMLVIDRVLVDAANPGNVGKMWGTYTRYDALTGKPIFVASPSALELPASLATLEQHSDLMNNVNGNLQFVRDNVGVIQVMSYYNSTTATESIPGGVRNYASQQSIRKGEFGTSILQSSTQYFSRSIPGTTRVLVAAQTQYPNEDQSNPLTTTYQYSFFAGTAAIQSQTITRPIVVTSQNGPNVATPNTSVYDRVGREIWTKDADGFLTFRAYDAESGSVIKTIVDVDTSRTSDFNSLPSGWATPSGGGLHLVSTNTVDRLGRTVETVNPNGNVTYTRYDDIAHSQRMYANWDPVTNRPTGPTRVFREDTSGSYTETLTMSAVPTVVAGKPTGTEAVSNIQSLSRVYRNAAGQTIHRDDYFNLTGITYSTASNLGTENVNFYRTRYSYNDQGLVERVQAPTGTITWTIYDGLRREIGTWIGTNDSTANGFKWSPSNNTGSSNMVQVSSMTYDAGSVGDGNVTQVIAMPGIGTNRVMQSAFDWRNRRVATKSGVEAIESESTNRSVSYTQYDNLGRVLSTAQYDGDTVNIHQDADNDGVPDAPDQARRRRFSQNEYDNLSRVFRSQTYLVDQSTGVIASNPLQSETWFDRRGYVLQRTTPSAPAIQSQYDGAGRLVANYTLGNIPSGSWNAASTVGQSVVLDSQSFTYDANGNTILVTSKQRFHDADSAATGELGSPNSGIPARVSYRSMHYDRADRTIASVDVGTNGGSVYTRPGTVPARSDSVLVSSMTYDDAGRSQDQTDPRGIVQRSLYDDLGRTVSSILNYTGGAPGASSDVTTNYTYDAAGRVATRTAVLAGGGGQTTQFIYQARTASGSAINSNDILTETRYPDASTGSASSSERDVLVVNALGDRVSLTDRDGTVHQYAYDALGRRVSDAVSTLGAQVSSSSVRRIEVGYDSAGIQARTTSYDAASGGNVLNEVFRTYNGFGQLTEEYQSHTGSVSLGTTPKVAYSYSEANGGNHSRLTQMVYPNGRSVSYDYEAGVDAAISRLSQMSDDGLGTVLEEYEYLGLGTVVERGRPEVGIELTMVSQNGTTGEAGDQYTGLDRFGRVVDQRWISGSGLGANDVDRVGYTYDRNSNRTARTNALDAAFSETYSYDGLNQLVDYARNGGGSGPQSQQWDLDALGNWSSLTSDGTPVSRTHNAQNELTQVGSSSLAYSPTGNLTTDAQGRTLAYDAWNRLVSVRNASGTEVARYGYDGLNRRIVEQVGTLIDPAAASATKRDMFYSMDWQVLEERVRGLDGMVSSVADAQYVWSRVYVDAMVLRDRNADGDGSTGSGGLEERIYALHDANWNTTALIVASGVPGASVGDILQRFVYTPFGEVDIRNADWSAAAGAAAAWQHLFQGLKFSDVTGLAYVRNRDYSASLGRFIELDPIGFDAGDNNWYRFVGNGPVGRLDPWGLMDSTPILSSEVTIKLVDNPARLKTGDYRQYGWLNISYDPLMDCIKFCDHPIGTKFKSVDKVNTGGKKIVVGTNARQSQKDWIQDIEDWWVWSLAGVLSARGISTYAMKATGTEYDLVNIQLEEYECRCCGSFLWTGATFWKPTAVMKRDLKIFVYDQVDKDLIARRTETAFDPGSAIPVAPW
jgi:RHS repeat-associated protein